ncbi:MAG: ribokinase [Candidatus Accumulibacter sp.]|jgi:ribokinase|nr:ribokinase [Accumulibacter sp.]
MDAKILVFGSMNADLVFAVDTLPRPGETVLGPGYSVIPGGKGANQAVAAARAGVPVRMIGCLGKDGFADVLLESLTRAGVETSFIRRGSRPTGCAAIGVDAAGANQIMVAGGANLEVGALDVDDGWLDDQTILVLQMEVPAGENWSLIRRARERGVRVVLNAAPAAAVPTDILDRIDFLVVNEHELSTVAKAAGIAADDDAVTIARAMARKTRQACIVTLGAEGAFGCDAQGAWRVAALPVKAVDTTGAGDCFVGWLAARLARGDDLPEAMRWATVAAGQACRVHGAQPSLPGFDAVAAGVEKFGVPAAV